MCGRCDGLDIRNDEDYWKSLKEYENTKYSNNNQEDISDEDLLVWRESYYEDTTDNNEITTHETVNAFEQLEQLRIEELKRLNQYNLKVTNELNKLFGIYK